MAAVPIKELGAVGVIKDMEPALLPPNAFTDARNVRFRNGSIETILGESIIYSLDLLQAEYGIHWPRPDGGLTIFAKDGVVKSRDSLGVEAFMLNSGGYTDAKWNMDLFGGGYAVFFNDGNSTPLYALVDDPTADLTLQAFPGWNYNESIVVKAKVIRPFGYALVAANLTLTEGATTTNAPVTVRISVQAPIGGFPQVWQPGLTTDTADEFEVNSKTPIQDMLELRGNMMIYSQDSIHTLSINNGIASVRPYSSSYGVLNYGCVVEFEGNHFVVDKRDIYVHNGSGKIDSVAEERIRDFFIDDVNPQFYSSVFVKKNNRYKEIWVCYPDNSSNTGRCNKAAIWSWKTGGWTFRDLPNLVSMFDVPPIVTGSFQTGKEIILGLNGTVDIMQMDSTYNMVNPTTAQSYQFESYITRDKLHTGDTLVDMIVSSLSPTLKVDNPDTVVNIYMSGQNVYSRDSDYSNDDTRSLFTIQPADEHFGYRIEPRTGGRYLNWKLISNQYWKLSHISMDMKPLSRR